MKRSSFFFLIVILLSWTALLGWDLWNPGHALIYRDIPRMGLPNLHFLGTALREGFIPYLDPHKGGGMPFLFDPQTAAWYPLSWLFALAGPETGFRLSQFFHLFWLGLGFALFHLRSGRSLSAAIFGGVTAVGAIPCLRALEWISLPAGFAWIPWFFLFAREQHFRVCGLTLGLMILSGHAYLWVATPVLAIAAWFLVKREARKALVMALGCALLTSLPVWGGYLSMASEFSAHGFDVQKAPPMIGFHPKHLALFFMPQSFLSFSFKPASGKEVFINREEKFSWTRDCYVGILPLLLVLLSISCYFNADLSGENKFDPASFKSSSFLIIMGFVYCLGFTVFSGLDISIFRHMYHPASFIFLTILGILLCAPSLFHSFQTSTNPEFFKGAELFFRAAFILGILVGALHMGFSHLAFQESLPPIWHYTFRSGGEAYLLWILFSGVFWFMTRRNQAPEKVFFMAGLILIHCFDLYSHGISAVPIATPREKLPKSILADIPPTLGRIMVTQDLIKNLKQISGVYGREATERFFSLASALGVPNGDTVRGFYHLGDYNPPFSLRTRERWLARLQQAPMHERGALLALAGVEFIVGLEDYIPEEYWQRIADLDFENLFKVILWRNPVSYPATVLSRSDLELLDHGKTPERILGVSAERVSWHGADCTISLGNISVEEGTLYVPINPLQGWRASVDGHPTSLLERPDGFGLAIPLASGTRTIELHYREVFFWPMLAMTFLGVVSLAFLGKYPR